MVARMRNPQDTLEQLLLKADPPWPPQSQTALLRYYQLVLKWNPRLHLTTLTRPELFYERHLREVAHAAAILSPRVTRVWDLGSGLGVPGIPLKLLLPALEVTLVEVSPHKAIFLETVIDELGLTGIVVDCRRFQEIPPLPEGSAIMARAVERMESILPEILSLGQNAEQIILFCSGHLASLLDRPTLYPLPGSHDRWLAELKCST
jgi:16S rRNA (guanine(527)-N(7))-methyltransferase RsmG